MIPRTSSSSSEKSIYPQANSSSQEDNHQDNNDSHNNSNFISESLESTTNYSNEEFEDPRSPFINSLVLPIENTRTSIYAAFRPETPSLQDQMAPKFSPEKKRIFDGYKEDIDEDQHDQNKNNTNDTAELRGVMNAQDHMFGIQNNEYGKLDDVNYSSMDGRSNYLDNNSFAEAAEDTINSNINNNDSISKPQYLYNNNEEQSDGLRQTIGSHIRLTSTQIEAMKDLGKSQENLLMGPIIIGDTSFPHRSTSNIVKKLDITASSENSHYSIKNSNTGTSLKNPNDFIGKSFPNSNTHRLGINDHTSASTETLVHEHAEDFLASSASSHMFTTKPSLLNKHPHSFTAPPALFLEHEDNDEKDLLSTETCFTLYQGFRAMFPKPLINNRSLLPTSTAMTLGLLSTIPRQSALSSSNSNRALVVTSTSLFKKNVKLITHPSPFENKGSQSDRTVFSKDHKSSLHSKENNYVNTFPLHRMTEQPHIHAMGNISVLFSQLIDARDEALEKNACLESHRLNLTQELKDIEDLLTKLTIRKNQVKDALKVVVESEDSMKSNIQILEDRISSIGQVTLDFEKKIRNIKSDTCDVAEAISLLKHKEDKKSFSCLKTLFGHHDSIECIDMDIPYGTAVTGSNDKSVRIYDLSSMRCQAEIIGHTGWIRCIQLRNKTVMTGSGDHTIKQWNLSTLPSLSTFTSIPCSDPLTRYNMLEDNPVNGNGRVLDHDDGQVSLNDCHHLLTQTFYGHQGAVSCLMFDSTRLLSGSSDKTIRQWDIETGECVAILRSEKYLDLDASVVGTDPFPSKSYFADQPEFISGVWQQEWFYGPTNSTTLPFWNSDQPSSKSYHGQESGLFKVYHVGGSVGALQFRGHGLAAGYGDGIVRLWDLRSGRCHRTLEGHLAGVTCLGFDDYHVVTGSMDKTVRIWDLRNGNVQSEIIFSHGVTSMNFDARRIVVAAGLREVQVYLRTSGTLKPLKDGHTKTARCVSYSEDWCISGGMDGLINVWNL